MAFRHPQPATEQDFERFCLKFLRRHWCSPGLVLYGKRGEKQYGIDILDVDGSVPFRAAQCKLHEDGKTIPPSEIRAEVSKAQTFPIPLDRYAIMTTARATTQAQNALIEINREHRDKGLFAVELITWDRIEDLLDAQYPELRDDLHPAGNAHLRMIGRQIAEVSSLVPHPL